MPPDPTERTPPQIDPIDAVASLAEPTRRRLYEAVVSSDEPVDRDDAARAGGVSRELAAFHLDRLVKSGLLEAVYRRRSGRSGPGAGRPAKFYRRPPETVALSLPARRYELAARLFATALGASRSERARARLFELARSFGAAIGARLERDSSLDLGPELRSMGYEPRERPDGTISLQNCPFDDLVEDHREVTCGMNLALLAGLCDAAGGELRAEPLPGDVRCCVQLRPVSADA
jgi:predicted ArsR family transcriptional regulator